MLQLSAAVVLGIVLLLGLPGCFFAIGTGTAPWKEEPAVAAPPPHPVIDGDWSEPVNGIRMAVREIVGTSADCEMWLLILIENTTRREVGWPGVIAENDVQFFGQPAGGSAPSGANLRIVAEPLDEQPTVGQALLQLSGMMRQLDTLAPGEIQLHAVRLHSGELLQQAMQQAPNQVEADSVYWPGLAEEAGVGRWRLWLTYRPEGFPQPPEEERLERAEMYNGWAGQQIDLPPVTVEVLPRGMSQNRQELRER